MVEGLIKLSDLTYKQVEEMMQSKDVAPKPIELKRNQGQLLPVVENPPSIPPRTEIACPATHPYVRYAAKSCPTCEHFDGIAKKSWSNESQRLEWHIEYCIRCRYPMERACRIVINVDEYEK